MTITAAAPDNGIDRILNQFFIQLRLRSPLFSPGDASLLTDRRPQMKIVIAALLVLVTAAGVVAEAVKIKIFRFEKREAAHTTRAALRTRKFARANLRASVHLRARTSTPGGEYPTPHTHQVRERIHGERGKGKYPTLYMHGVEYANACAPQERKKLRESVKRAAGRNRDASGAWQLVETLLCASNSKVSRRYLFSVLPPKIRLKLGGTAQDDTSELIKRDDKLIKSLLSKREAWNATIEPYAPEQNEINLMFSPDEACVRSRTLKFINKRWRLVELGEFCD